MSEKFVTVAQFSDYMEADLARQRLEDEGITVFVTGQHGGGYIGVPGIAKITLQAPESQAALAKELLDAWREQAAQGIDAEDSEPQDDGLDETGEDAGEQE